MTQEPKTQEDLKHLEADFLSAMDHLRHDRVNEARELLKTILQQEPRLPEPHLELAILQADEGDLENAVEHARQGVGLLEQGGQWVDDLSEDAMLSHALNLLGELLVLQCQSDQMDLESPALALLWNEAVACFGRAQALDADNPDARRNALMHQPMESPEEPEE